MPICTNVTNVISELGLQSLICVTYNFKLPDLISSNYSNSDTYLLLMITVFSLIEALGLKTRVKGASIFFQEMHRI